MHVYRKPRGHGYQTRILVRAIVESLLDPYVHPYYGPSIDKGPLKSTSKGSSMELSRGLVGVPWLVSSRFTVDVIW